MTTISRLEERQAIARQLDEVDAALVVAEAAYKSVRERRMDVRRAVIEDSGDVSPIGRYDIERCGLTGLPLFYGDRVYDFDGNIILAEAVTLPMPAAIEPIVLERPVEDEDESDEADADTQEAS